MRRMRRVENKITLFLTKIKKPKRTLREERASLYRTLGRAMVFLFLRLTEPSLLKKMLAIYSQLGSKVYIFCTDFWRAFFTLKPLKRANSSRILRLEILSKNAP